MKRLLLVIGVLLILSSCGTAAPRHEAPARLPVPLFTYVFDDGNDTDYLVARELFAEQGAVACSAVTTDWLNTRNHLSTAQVLALRDSGWEIMSHTATHPNLRSLTADRIEEEFARSRTALESMGVPVHNIVYPYNKSNELVRAVARRYYRSGRGGTNAVNWADTDAFDLRSYSYKHNFPGMKQNIDRACADGAWIIVYQHELDMKADLAARRGAFVPEEELSFTPSGATGRSEAPTWFQYFDSLYFVPLSGTPKAGDTVTGRTSGASARIDHFLYDDRAAVGDMLRYVRAACPEMRIVTIDQGLDILGVPKYNPHD